PAIGMDANGDFVIAWDTYFEDGSGRGVYAQRFQEVHPPRVAGVQVNGGAAQRSRVTQLQVNFDSVVNLPPNPADAFQLQPQSDNALVNLTVAVTNDTATHVTLTFHGGLSEFGSLEDGRYTLTVIAAQVSNANGPLDGNGDGTPGDDYVLASSAV